MINKVTLLGRLGRDPELRNGNNTAVARLSIATTEKWRDKQGNPQERTEWHNVSLFGRQAEIAGEYLHKGELVYIEGSIRTSSYEKDGETRYSTDILGRELKLMPRATQQAQQQPRQAPAAAGDDFTDDIPF